MQSKSGCINHVLWTALRFFDLLRFAIFMYVATYFWISVCFFKTLISSENRTTFNNFALKTYVFSYVFRKRHMSPTLGEQVLLHGISHVKHALLLVGTNSTSLFYIINSWELTSYYFNWGVYPFMLSIRV